MVNRTVILDQFLRTERGAPSVPRPAHGARLTVNGTQVIELKSHAADGAAGAFPSTLKRVRASTRPPSSPEPARASSTPRGQAAISPQFFRRLRLKRLHALMGVLLAVGLAFAWLGGGRRRSAPAMVATASTERLPTLATNPSAPPPLRSIGSLVTTTGSAAPPPSLAVAAAAYAIGDYATALEHYAALAQSEPSPLYATVTKVLTRKLAATPEGRVRR